MSSPRHDAARQWAQAGIPVFPCVPGGKQPATPNGFKDATTDLEQIDAWWSKADYNLAVEPDRGGWAIIDLDGAAGEKEWGTLGNDRPATYAVRTPRGGRHLYFSGRLPPSVSKLGPWIDTRGVGSYILLPPSVTPEGEYVVEVDCDPAPLPDWVLPALAARQRNPAPAPEGLELDTPAALARARSAVAGYPPAVEGQGGDAHTYKLAATLADLGVSEGVALDLMSAWNATCVPPWEDEALAYKIASGYRNRQNAIGAHAIVGSGSSTFGPAAANLSSAPATPYAGRFKGIAFADRLQIAEPPWLIPNWLPDDATAMIFGAKGTLKSFVALDIALSVAAGVSCLGQRPLRQGRTFFCGAEGLRMLAKARTTAWLLAHGLEPATILPIHFLPPPRLAIAGETEEFANRLTELCAGERPALIVLDTFSKIMSGLDESKPADVAQFIRFVEALREAFDCPILTLHHLGKDAGRGARGHSSIIADQETLIELEAEKPIVRAMVRYHKDAENPPPFQWELRNVAMSGSAALFPISAQEHAAMAGTADIYDRGYIHATLLAARATNLEHALDCTGLARMLRAAEAKTGQDEGQWESLIAATARRLGALGRSKLRGYCEVSGGKAVWFLPPA